MNALKKFFELEAAGGILLAAAAIVALVLANSPLHPVYDQVLNARIFSASLVYWINDGLMAVFFYMIGLEIKREFAEGRLSSARQALLPVLAALGGMIVPAIVFMAMNGGAPENLRGWAIPTATDIAFSLGVLGLLGSRVPIELKIFLTAIAVIDDMGAILIIAVFYAHGFHPEFLMLALGIIAALLTLNLTGVSKGLPYIVLTVILWAAVLQSGIHATLAGIAGALFIPLRAKDGSGISPLQSQMHILHPYVCFGILPVFSLANAGVPFDGLTFAALYDPLTIGIILGLFIGKQLGVFAAVRIAVASRLCALPENLSWGQVYGMAVLCGIGFTMSLFIGGLAFTGVHQQAEIRLGVLVGSLLSAISGYFILRR
jgi:Na+:H+ antiporter, NhaA family